jgi:HD domain
MMNRPPRSRESVDDTGSERLYSTVHLVCTAELCFVARDTASESYLETERSQGRIGSDGRRMTVKPQRVRDPVHNLIEFDTGQFESTLWRVIQTPPFQRLRRIRQLGFSEFVFPGAAHTRFAHSIGVFHIARALMEIIKRHIVGDRSRQFGEYQAKVALAAALLHDVGHGMFSHAFEKIGESLNLPMANHENVSEALICDSEITEALNRDLGSGFAQDVAALIGRREPGNLYDAVVSSQFDADRLDYMQRDRLMTGVQSSGIDLIWLLANLEIASVRTGADADPTVVPVPSLPQRLPAQDHAGCGGGIRSADAPLAPARQRRT